MPASRRNQDISTEHEYLAQMAEVAIRRGLDADAALRFAHECVQQQKKAREAERLRELTARGKIVKIS